MSMDFGLEHKQKISLDRLKSSLQNRYNIKSYSQKSPEDLEFFVLSPKDNPDYKLEYYKQKDAKYWFYTYDYDADSLKYFADLTSEIAEKLGCTIYDKQNGNSGISPQDFKDYDQLSKWAKSLIRAKSLPLEYILNHPEKYNSTNSSKDKSKG